MSISYQNWDAVCFIDVHSFDSLTSPLGLLEPEFSTVSPETCEVTPPTSTLATFFECWPEHWPASLSARPSIALVGVACFCSPPSSPDCHRCCCWPSLSVLNTCIFIIFSTLSVGWLVCKQDYTKDTPVIWISSGYDGATVKTIILFIFTSKPTSKRIPHLHKHNKTATKKSQSDGLYKFSLKSQPNITEQGLPLNSGRVKGLII